MDKKKVGIIAGVAAGVGGLIYALSRTAHAQPGTFCSPIQGEEGICFGTLAELEAYLQANYPPELIDIVWS